MIQLKHNRPLRSGWHEISFWGDSEEAGRGQSANAEGHLLPSDGRQHKPWGLICYQEIFAFSICSSYTENHIAAISIDIRGHFKLAQIFLCAANTLLRSIFKFAICERIFVNYLKPQRLAIDPCCNSLRTKQPCLVHIPDNVNSRLLWSDCQDPFAQNNNSLLYKNPVIVISCLYSKVITLSGSTYVLMVG